MKTRFVLVWVDYDGQYVEYFDTEKAMNTRIYKINHKIPSYGEQTIYMGEEVIRK